MLWPQYTLLALVMVSLGIHLAKHGEQRIEKYNFWTLLVSDIIILSLLYAGGFFDVMK